MSQKNQQQQKKPRTAITPTRDEDFPQWYQEVIKAADLAENSPVRGCMVIKPDGYALWENIQAFLDKLIKQQDVRNAYFPLLIPLSYIAKEAEHIDGFAKECAVVTHHRLEADGKGGLKPAGELQEPYVIRPTSETIIAESMSKWIQSYRDLPLKLNQWCNVMRWEMRPRIFLRTSEFLWQEGHNAFATAEEAEKDAKIMIDVYRQVAEDLLAIPVIIGEKTDDEKFPGAVSTLTIEAMMQDGKSLQAGTSHYLGTTFSKAENITYQAKEGGEEFCHTTSWGLSTRMIGGLIMTHSDDDGLRLPPAIAPTQVIILPITKGKEGDDAVLKACEDLKTALIAKDVRARVDTRDIRNGDKMWDSIKKGVPLRVEIGAREAEAGQATVTRRDIGRDSKETITHDILVSSISERLDAIQQNLFNEAKAYRDSRIVMCDTIEQARDYFKTEGNNAGFVKMNVAILQHPDFETLKKDFSLTPRCKPTSKDTSKHMAENGKTVLIGRSY